MARKDVVEQVLAQVAEGEETRQVVLIGGDAWSVVEQTEGPVTEAAYGSWRHVHKMLGDAGAFARALDSEPGAVADALAAFFVASGDEGEVALLSDLMDQLDRAGEPYTYVAWNVEGDVVRRVE